MSDKCARCAANDLILKADMEIINSLRRQLAEALFEAEQAKDELESVRKRITGVCLNTLMRKLVDEAMPDAMLKEAGEHE